jgi:subtilisin-like proprotein convertase family protein
MKPQSLLHCLTLALVLLAPGTAGGAATTTVYSSGDLAAAIPDSGVLEQRLAVPDPGLLADVDVRVRIAHPNDGDLTLTLVAPDGKAVLLAKRRGGAGDDYGSGAESCAGKPAIFDDEAPFSSDPIHLASPPFTGRHWPEEFLGALDGREGQGDWTLRVRDGRPGGVGVLLCFELAVTRVDPTVLVAEAGAVRAELTYSEYDGNVTQAGLAISRDGAPIVRDSIAEACQSCFALVLSDRALKVRDLDADGEPEVVLDLYTGGAHCCTYSWIYRYLPAEGRYVRTRHDWGNVGYTLKDLARDGWPEFRSADDRFAYAFSCYACSWFPPRIWRYDAGRIVDVTRQFPAIVRNDARRAWREYLQLRNNEQYDVRAILAGYVADRALLGEFETAWRQLLAARSRGDLDEPGAGESIWPEEARYLKQLRRFLERAGYLS